MKAKYIYIGLGVIGVAGLSYYLYKQFKKLTDFCYKFTNFRFLKFTYKEAIIELSMLLETKSDIKVELKNYSFDILINGVKVANVNNNINNIIQPKGISKIYINVLFAPKKVFDLKTISTLIATNKDNGVLRVKGTIKAKVAGIIGTGNYPIDVQMTFKEMAQPDDSSVQKKCSI